MADFIEKITLDTLSPDSVSVKKQQYVEFEGVEYPIGEPWRRAYVNNSVGRAAVVDEIPEPYQSAIFAVWGETQTVSDPTPESEPE